jgi:hypothetical protein
VSQTSPCFSISASDDGTATCDVGTWGHAHVVKSLAIASCYLGKIIILRRILYLGRFATSGFVSVCRSSVFIHWIWIRTPNQRTATAILRASDAPTRHNCHLSWPAASRWRLDRPPLHFSSHPSAAGESAQWGSIGGSPGGILLPLPRLFPPLLAIYSWFWMGFGARLPVAFLTSLVTSQSRGPD